MKVMGRHSARSAWTDIGEQFKATASRLRRGEHGGIPHIGMIPKPGGNFFGLNPQAVDFDLLIPSAGKPQDSVTVEPAGIPCPV